MTDQKSFKPVSAPYREPKERIHVEDNKPYSDGYTVRISSDKRLTAGDPNYPETYFTYALKVPRPSTGPDFNRVACLSAAIPKTWWTVDTTTGNQFVLEELGVQRTITVPPGNYDVVQWTKQIPPLLTAASTAMGHGWTYTATQQLIPDTGFIIYTVTGNAGNQPSLIINAQGNLDAQVGFDAGTTSTFVNNSITTTQVYCAQGEFSVLLRSDCCAADGDDTLCSVYGTNLVAPKSVMVWQSQDYILNSKRYDRSKDNVATFHITSANTGAYLDTHGYPCSFDLKFFYVPTGHLQALFSIDNTQQQMLEEAKLANSIQQQLLDEMKLLNTNLAGFFSTLKGNLALSTSEPPEVTAPVVGTDAKEPSAPPDSDVRQGEEDASEPVSETDPRAGEDESPAEAPQAIDPRAGEDGAHMKASAGDSLEGLDDEEDWSSARKF